MQDITAPKHGVEVQLQSKGPSGTVVRVNVDGECVLRICRIPTLIVELDNDFNSTVEVVKDGKHGKVLLHLEEPRCEQ